MILYLQEKAFWKKLGLNGSTSLTNHLSPNFFQKAFFLIKEL